MGAALPRHPSTARRVPRVSGTGSDPQGTWGAGTSPRGSLFQWEVEGRVPGTIRSNQTRISGEENPSSELFTNLPSISYEN